MAVDMVTCPVLWLCDTVTRLHNLFYGCGHGYMTCFMAVGHGFITGLMVLENCYIT